MLLIIIKNLITLRIKFFNLGIKSSIYDDDASTNAKCFGKIKLSQIPAPAAQIWCRLALGDFYNRLEDFKSGINEKVILFSS